MQYSIPDYYKEFHCIADQCEETCCAGWQIQIDPASLKKYFPMLTEEADELVIYYDKKFRECEKSKGFFAMHISVSQEGSVNHAHIRVTAPDRTEDIYSLSLRYPASARPVSSEKERTGDVS